jgi:hypothetical protein
MYFLTKLDIVIGGHRFERFFTSSCSSGVVAEDTARQVASSLFGESTQGTLESDRGCYYFDHTSFSRVSPRYVKVAWTREITEDEFSVLNRLGIGYIDIGVLLQNMMGIL